MRRASLAAIVLAAALLPTAAAAHVTVQPEEAIAGGFATFVFQVPNERDDADTVKLEVQFPPAFASVSFQPKDAWKRTVRMVQFDEPIEAFGEQVTEGVGTVTWTGGRIEPGEFETFAFSVGPLPEGELEFRAIQTYSSGEVVRWIGPPDSDQPAPRVTAVPLDAGEDEGELAVLADIQDQIGRLRSEVADDSVSGGPGMLLGSAGLVLAAIALIAALRRRS